MYEIQIASEYRSIKGKQDRPRKLQNYIFILWHADDVILLADNGGRPATTSILVPKNSRETCTHICNGNSSRYNESKEHDEDSGDEGPPDY
ncbi:hypothetical protein Trydic_g3815 [Trypoxylus dichotomus]